MKAAGPLQKLLHLANAREALASGDLEQALNEADAAIDADSTFAAAQTLRVEIVARMNAAMVSERVVSVVAAAPVAVAMAVTADPEPATPSIPVPVVDPIAPLVVLKTLPSRRRARASTPTSVAITLGTLVVLGGVGIALLATGIIGREPSSVVVRPAAVRPATPQRATPSDVALPTPVRPTAAAASATAAIAKSDPSPAEPVGTQWASPRLAQLSVRPRWRASALHVDDNALLRDLGQGIGELWIGKLTGNEDAVFVGGSLDASEWMKLRASIKPTGVVWRIYSNRSSPSDVVLAGAVTAGFSRVKKVRYSADYSGEQYALRRLVR